MLFSVIIPTYNSQDWIAQCISGILRQTFKDFEIVISDDSNNDLTENIVISFSDERIRYYRNLPRLGRVENYRICINERSAGEWCLICDGDDYLFDVNYLADVSKIIEQNSDLVMVQAGHLKGKDYESSSEELPRIKQASSILSGFEYLVRFNEIGHFSHLSTLGKRSALIEIDAFRMDILSSDIETYLRLARLGKVCLMRRLVGLWRQHEKNVSGNASIKNQIDNLKWIDSVANEWICNLNVDQKGKVLLWKKNQLKVSLLYLYKQLLYNKNTSFSDFCFLISHLLNEGYYFYLFNSRISYALLLKYIQKKIVNRV